VTSGARSRAQAAPAAHARGTWSAAPGRNFRALALGPLVGFLHGRLGVSWVQAVSRWIEAAGVGLIVVGGVLASTVFAVELVRRHAFLDAYGRYRANLGRAILLGLELLVAGDIISTLLVEQTIESVGVLAVIVLIRTFLSFSLETEIEGTLPWRRRVAGAADRAASR
jgi:uncharacterized membrane protein